MKRKIAMGLVLALVVSLLMPAECGKTVYAKETSVSTASKIQIREKTGTLKPSGKVPEVREQLAGRNAVSTYKDCFGNQLDGDAKALYEALVKHYVEEGAKDSYTYMFQTPFAMETETPWANIDEDENFQQMEEEIARICQEAIDAFGYDHPEIFWIYGTKYRYSISGHTTGNGCAISISDVTLVPEEVYEGAYEQRGAYEQAVEAALLQIKESCKDPSNRYELLGKVHDWVCQKASYYNGQEKDAIYTTAPVFLGDGQVVCEGYAKAIKVLCDRLEIPCILVGGVVNPGTSGEEGHMWNQVQMEDENWYLIDATWDDQASGVRTTYFLAGQTSTGFDGNKLCEERQTSGDFSGAGFMEFAYPVWSTKAYTKPTKPSEEEQKMAPPETVDGENTDTGIHIFWSQIENADGYDVWKKENGTWKRLVRVEGKEACSYTDTEAIAGVSYYYRIVSYRMDGNQTVESKKSEYKKVRRLLATKATAQVNGKGTILSWKRITGASGYCISRKEYGKTDWLQLSEVTSGKMTGFTDETAKNGVKYVYSVQGYFEDSKSVQKEDTVYLRLAAPKIKSYKRKTSTSYLMQWNANTRATGYQIQYSKSSLFLSRKTLNIPAENVQTTLKNLTKNQTYYVRIRSYYKEAGNTFYSPWTASSNTKNTRTLKSSGVYKKSGKKKVLFELRTRAGQALYQYDTVQGSATDGKYSYYILYNRKVEKCKIVKVRNSDWKVIKVSAGLPLDHGNDMTYNPDTKRLIVLHSTGNAKRLSIIRTDTLKIESYKDVKVSSILFGATQEEAKAITGFSAIAYNQKRKQYVVHLGKSGQVLILDVTMEPVKYIHLSRKNNYINQGIEVTDDYILIGQSPKYSSQKYNILSVYDWDGTYISMLQVKRGQELESLYRTGNNFYASFYTTYYRTYYKTMKIVVKEKGKKKKKTVKLRQRQYMRANYIYKVSKI